MIIAIYALSLVLILVALYEIGIRGYREVTKERCTRGGPLHRFEGRYTVLGSGIHTDKLTLFFTNDEHKADVIKAMTGKKLYRGDVCVWCGKVVNEQGTHV